MKETLVYLNSFLTTSELAGTSTKLRVQWDPALPVAKLESTLLTQLVLVFLYSLISLLTWSLELSTDTIISELEMPAITSKFRLLALLEVTIAEIVP